MNRAFLLITLLAALGAGCKKSSTTTSPTTTDTTTASAPTATDSFSDTLPVGVGLSYPFNVGVYGTVNVTVTSIGGAGVPTTVQVMLGIGSMSTGTCVPSITALAKPGAVGVTATEQPGAYCVTITDVGNLAGPANFSMNVDHS